MKRIIFLCLIIISPNLFALYSGNPALPALIEEGLFFCKENWFSVKAGYERDWVFDRNMNVINIGGGRMTDFSSIADQGLLTFNIIDRIEVYGSAGAMQIEATHIPMTGVRNEYDTHNQLTWGAGARAIICEWTNITLGIDGKYQRARPKMRWLASNGVPIKLRSGSKIRFSEWQIGIGLSYQINIFYPYMTAKYSNATANFVTLPPGIVPGGTHFKTKNRRKFGLALGCSLSNTSRFDASVEVRMIDEQAVTLAGEIKF